MIGGVRRKVSVMAVSWILMVAGLLAVIGLVVAAIIALVTSRGRRD
jgi:hypothetical protein